MGLKITNKATAKQQAILAKLEYTGQGKYAADQLTSDQAEKLITELINQSQLHKYEIEDIMGNGSYIESVEQLKEGR
jgi:hypothetical protein